MGRTVLHLNASAQVAERSNTRRLGEIFMTHWLAAVPDTRLLRRDLSVDPVPFVDAEWIAAAFTRPEDRTPEMMSKLALSDRLIDEVIAADLIVLGTPMYNYGMPAALKAWFDQIARIGRTFSFDLTRGDFPIEPILSGKTLVVLSSRGEFGFAPGGVRAHMNTLDPGIAACAHYLGVAREDIHTIAIERQEFKDARYHQSVTDAENTTADLAMRLSLPWAAATVGNRRVAVG